MPLRRYALIGLLLTVACHRSSGARGPANGPGVGASSSAPAAGDGARGGATARVTAFAGDLGRGPIEAPAAEPSASYPSVKVACDSAQSWLRHALDTTIARRDGPFTNEFLTGTRRGCVLDAEGRMSSYRNAGPDSSVMDRFMARGWVAEWHISADGPDGTDFGLRSRDVLCVAEFRWDGGDDSDSTVVPGDWYTLKLACSPWFPKDTVRAP